MVDRTYRQVREELKDGFHLQFTLFDQRLAAWDWFTEQRDDPDLMRRRGLQPGEPLPRELALFDDTGLPLPQQERSHWLRLRRWLDDDDAVLNFVFPDGIDSEDEKVLRGDLERLKTRSWSPQAAVNAILADWPEDQETMNITLTAGEKPLIEACDRLLAELDEPGGAVPD